MSTRSRSLHDNNDYTPENDPDRLPTDDDGHEPPPSANTHPVHVTPSQREDRLTSLSKNAKTRVNSATGPRCFIENTNEENHVEYAHVMQRATPDSLLTSLERSWGMTAKTLNVDTRQNIFRLSVKFHRSFDNDGWLLIPEKRILQMYVDAAKTSGHFPEINDPSYSYAMIASKKMKHIPIHRQNYVRGTVAGAVEDPIPAAADFTHFAYPFVELRNRRLISHIHPRFVIVNSAQKWIRRAAQYYTDVDIEQEMSKIGFIFEVWMQPPADSEPPAQPNIGNRSGASVSSSKKTAPTRLRQPSRAVSKRQADSPTDGSPRPRNRARPSEGRH